MKDRGDFIGTSVEHHTEIPVERLGSPGASSVLIIVPEYSDNRFAGKSRHNDTTMRAFSCKARLSENPGDTRRFNAAFGKDDGSSHLLVDKQRRKIKLTTRTVKVLFETNGNGEISMAAGDVTSTNENHAKAIFEDALTPWLDKLSYAHQVPIHLAQIVVHDVLNDTQHFYFQSPPRHSKIQEGEDKIVERMMPIYALYREAQNASAPFYKVLSLFKIMEGLLNPLRTEVLRDLRKQRRNQNIPKLTVPDHPDIAEWLRIHVGQPVGVFVNGFLTNEYRNAIAHFELRDRRAMNVGSSKIRTKGAEVAFLADLCARVLIENHENLLARLDAKTD
ncbi:MAG TPA: methylamine utilization protein MauJ [Pararhizobium sp.]|uniref:methylamine utilization protein MauJ n=1 Tax=Pararhizobium sp. TaxID=1977563 RepID=UPI002CF32083|nr:methylamine utilization protein MauJ [Pararhizobium sp.]HTO34286.1 methylamine utilization protein MauJ [Pararhizobium sp.]